MLDVFTNFFVCSLVLTGALIGLWKISVNIKNASIIDIFWGAGFAIVGAVCLLLASHKTPYIWLLGLLPIIWGIRLTLYLAKRNLGHDEDKRYVSMRKRSGLEEMAWRKRALYTVFFGQGLLIMIVSAPIWIGIANAWTHETTVLFDYGTDITRIGVLASLGTLLWLIGFLFEAVGDYQLQKFIAANKGYDGPIETKPVLDTGLWAYTRHPNYFGNACMWWGIYLIATTAPWGWITIFSPIIMTYLLVKVSGKDMLERDMGRRESYKAYIAKTSGFFPMPPKKE